MIISVDYDKTYTRDKPLFNSFIESAKTAGHEIVCVTMRRPSETISDIPCKVIYTSRRAKVEYVRENGILIDIWIDDSPDWFFNDG